MTTSFEEFTQRGSGWILENIVKMELFSARYQPLASSSYIPLPKKLVAKKAVLNIQNEDEKCFLWCVLAHKLNLHWKDNPRRVSHYTSHEYEILMKNIDYPVAVNKIHLVEKMNRLRINVYGYEDDEVFPLYISKHENEDCINLLHISDNSENGHYCLIRSMSRLLGDLTKHKCASYYCYRCLHRFSTENILKEHLTYCNEHSPQHVKMPNKGENTLKFVNVHYQHRVPYVIYADFESILEEMPTANPNNCESYTVKTSKHTPCGFAYIVIGPNGKSVKPITVYRGPNAVDRFFTCILNEKNELAEKLIANKPLKMTQDDMISFENAKECSICKTPLLNNRVKDHDHLTGVYRGALHQECNLKYKLRKMIPVIFHNLKNYDGHHLMEGIGKVKDYQLNVIANNMEKYISFSLSNEYKGTRITLQFIDSLQFLNTSLEKLVDNLEPSQFKILKENIPSNIDLLLRKGIYPYEYMSNFNKFDETALPSKDAFYSTLSGENITDEEYQHAQTVWNAFSLHSLGEFHDLYVKCDVLQLADVFQSFRELCYSYYGLDPAHLMTSPGLAWQACLKMTGQTLELLTDVDMHLFIEKGIRGGISMISKRYAQANNKYMEEYDKTKPSKYLMYWDANNLYGWAMSQPLPYGDFQWMSSENVTEEWIHSIPDNSEEGYILEVDLIYPKELHELHNDYPLAPERFNICQDMLSPYAKELLPNTPFTKSEKLVPNLQDKEKYVVYYKNLKFYLSSGLKLGKVHKVLQFKQSPWLKSYIDFNTDRRKDAQSTFEKDFFKLLNNAVYGKTMENIRKHVDIQLVNSTTKAKKMSSAPTFQSFSIFNDDLVGVERVKKTLILNRPIYVGFVILELSKILMYDFHYNYIKHLYGSNASLLFTDTDSLTYSIQTKDVYEDMKTHLDLFDTSDYPKDYPLYDIKNKKVIGKFKDEMNGEPILEFIGLRAKMYSLITSKDEKKTAKGISRFVIKKRLKHSHYKECLFSSKCTREVQMRIQSEKHRMFTIQQNKVGLSSFDDKRYILPDGVSTLAYGHYKISEQNL